MVIHKYPHFNPDKYQIDVKIASVKSSFHVKYNINYHIVWIPKYRKDILKDKVKEVLKTIIEGQCQQYGWDMLALEVMPDHVHLFLGAKPNWASSKIVNLLKGNTSRQLRLVFPHLKYLGYKNPYKQFDSLWADGYYVGTAGHVSQEQVVRYILNQTNPKSHHHLYQTQEKLEVKGQSKLGDYFG